MTAREVAMDPTRIEKKRDYSSEPMALVTFEVAEALGGTLLTITETGFDRLPLDRRAKA